MQIVILRIGLALLGLGLMAAPQSAHAQKRSNGTYITRLGFNLLGGYARNAGYQADSYARFQNAYNSYYRSRLRSPLTPLNLAGGWFYGVDFHVGPLYMGFVQHRMLSTAISELRSGDRREIILDLRPLDLNADIMLPAGRRVELGFALGWQQQQGTLSSGYRYANGGPLSYAEDQGLNGIYRTRGGNALSLGARVDLKLLKRQQDKSLLTLSLRAERVGVFQSYLSGKSELLPWHDVMITQATNGAINNDGQQSFYLCEDPRDEFNRAVRFGGQGTSINGAFTGWRACATLIITPLEWILPD